MTILKHADFEVPGFGEFSQPPIAVPAYAEAVMSLNPIAYWRLGEQAGTTLSDQTGAHDLTVSGTHTLGQAGAVATDNDSAVLFNAGTAISADAVLPTTAGAALSLVFWLRSSDPVQNDKPFMGQYLAGQPGRTLLTLLANGTVRYITVGDSSFITNATVSTDWRMLVYTRASDATGSWYVDGQLDKQSASHDEPILDTPFGLGKLTSAVPDVLLDEVAVFDNALSHEQIRWLFGLAQGELAVPPVSMGT